MFAEFGESSYDQQFLPGRCRVDFFVLENPGIAVRDEDCVQSRSQGGIDIRLGAIPDHPGGVAIALVSVGDMRVDLGNLFGHDFRRTEIFLHAGAFHLSKLLPMVSLRDEDQAMPLREIC